MDESKNLIMNDDDTRVDKNSLSYSDCNCFVAGYDLSEGELSALILDSSQCPLHIYNEENEPKDWLTQMEG